MTAVLCLEDPWSFFPYHIPPALDPSILVHGIFSHKVQDRYLMNYRDIN